MLTRVPWAMQHDRDARLPLLALPAHSPGEVSRALGGDQRVHRGRIFFLPSVCTQDGKHPERQAQAPKGEGRAGGPHRETGRRSACNDRGRRSSSRLK